MNHLFIPSIGKAGLSSILPISKGSELIHSKIIANLESADLVLCDMSILNPNVFFELGIRTALNKPVCLVKDDLTHKIPFDINLINNHTYSNAIYPWNLDSEVEKLANHLKESLTGSDNSNDLWKYFSLSSTAHPVEPKNGVESQIELLNMQIEALRNQLNTNELIDQISNTEYESVDLVINEWLFYKFGEIISTQSEASLDSLSHHGKLIDIEIEGSINEETKNKLNREASKLGFELKLRLF